MGNRPKLKPPSATTIQPGPGPHQGCPCCASLGLPGQVTVTGPQLLACCEHCQAAVLGIGSHPHAVPHQHWHERPGPDGVEDLCPTDGCVTQTCVVADHRDHALVNQGQAATHDSLVEGLGQLRCSGVWWTHHVGADALATVDDIWPLEEDLEPRVLEVRNATIEHLEANDQSMLIVAWCLAADPTGGAT